MEIKNIPQNSYNKTN